MRGDAPGRMAHKCFCQCSAPVDLVERPVRTWAIFAIEARAYAIIASNSKFVAETDPDNINALDTQSTPGACCPFALYDDFSTMVGRYSSKHLPMVILSPNDNAMP